MRGFRVPGWQRTRCIIVPTVLRGAERIRRMIYIARARREDVFLLVFFLYSWRGVHQWGLKTITLWVCGTLLPKKNTFF
jgi:hypothetical protein